MKAHPTHSVIKTDNDPHYTIICGFCGATDGFEGEIGKPCRKNNSLVVEQDSPIPSSGDVWLLVLRDMEDRRKGGIEKYGTSLQPHNGRDALVDAYQEALDLCVYLRQAIEERKTAR